MIWGRRVDGEQIEYRSWGGEMVLVMGRGGVGGEAACIHTHFPLQHPTPLQEEDVELSWRAAIWRKMGGRERKEGWEKKSAVFSSSSCASWGRKLGGCPWSLAEAESMQVALALPFSYFIRTRCTVSSQKAIFCFRTFFTAVKIRSLLRHYYHKHFWIKQWSPNLCSEGILTIEVNFYFEVKQDMIILLYCVFFCWNLKSVSFFVLHFYGCSKHAATESPLYQK